MPELREIKVPDIGDFDAVDVVEVLVEAGAHVEPEQSLITIESEKASMEVPSPVAGTVRDVRVRVGDKVGEGAVIVTVEVDGAESATEPPASKPAPKPEAEFPAKAPPKEAPPKEAAPKAAAPEARAPAEAQEPTPRTNEAASESQPEPKPPGPAMQGHVQEPSTDARREPPHVPSELHPDAPKAHASPSVRKFARELGVELNQVESSGPQGRVLKEDVQEFVKSSLAKGGGGIPEIPAVDFSRYGEIEMQPLSRINRLTARNVHRSWLNVPQVTQFDEADITEIEAFRKEHGRDAEGHGYKLTFVSFILKAAAATLHAFPRFNSSLAPDGEQLVIKKYFHIGVAVDTDEGLVVPVIRDVDRKTLLELARELAEVSERARAGKLQPTDIQGASFSVSSLGGIGGTGFTPIVNAPEVAILGVARAKEQPVYVDGVLKPRLMLPIALTYDHRVIDGASAARFVVHLKQLLTDFRLVVL